MKKLTHFVIGLAGFVFFVWFIPKTLLSLDIFLPYGLLMYVIDSSVDVGFDDTQIFDILCLTAISTLPALLLACVLKRIIIIFFD